MTWFLAISILFLAVALGAAYYWWQSGAEVREEQAALKKWLEAGEPS